MLILCPLCAAQNRSFKSKFNQKGLKTELFSQKTQKFFCVFFLRPLSGVTNFNTSPMPPLFRKLLLDELNSEQKPSVKKPVDRADQKPVDRPVNRRGF